MLQLVVIEAGRAQRDYWRDVWRYREVLYFLTWGDLLVRYKQTVVGIAWAVFPWRSSRRRCSPASRIFAAPSVALWT